MNEANENELYTSMRERFQLPGGSIDEVVEALEEDFGDRDRKSLMVLICPFARLSGVCDFELAELKPRKSLQEIMFVSTAAHMLTTHHALEEV